MLFHFIGDLSRELHTLRLLAYYNYNIITDIVH